MSFPVHILKGTGLPDSPSAELTGAMAHILHELAEVASMPESGEEWTPEEFSEVRPDLTDELSLAHVRLIYNAALRKGKTREQVIEMVDGLMLEALPGECVPIPVLFGVLVEGITPIRPGGVWRFGQEAEACRNERPRRQREAV